MAGINDLLGLFYWLDNNRQPLLETSLQAARPRTNYQLADLEADYLREQVAAGRRHFAQKSRKKLGKQPGKR